MYRACKQQTSHSAKQRKSGYSLEYNEESVREYQSCDYNRVPFFLKLVKKFGITEFCFRSPEKVGPRASEAAMLDTSEMAYIIYLCLIAGQHRSGNRRYLADRNRQDGGSRVLQYMYM